MARKHLTPTEYVIAKHSVRSLRANSAAGITCSVKAVRVHLPAGDGQYDAMHYQSVECPECGQRMDKERIMGGNTKNTPCNGKCMGATGPACDCWCEGKNHGGSHAA